MAKMSPRSAKAKKSAAARRVTKRPGLSQVPDYNEAMARVRQGFRQFDKMSLEEKRQALFPDDYDGPVVTGPHDRVWHD